MIEVLSARAFWCAPDEQILWCHAMKSVGAKAKYVLYQVSGLDERGDKRWTAGKVLGGAAGGVAGAALEIVSPTEDSANTPMLPRAVVSGRNRECLAVAQLGSWQASGVNDKSGREFVWILTSHRLGLLEFSEQKSGGGADSGLLGGLRKKIGGSADQQDVEGDQPQPAELPGVTVHAEFPRNIIANIEVVQQRVKGQERKFLRIVLADGSAIDLSHPGGGSVGDGKIDRLLAMSLGRE
ncbi:hypothetical protein [Saccharopolyspora sp. 5N708]|uniref:hypothetical protein n=1 Tax=Saccharopolyspora sp. 5N708 TaxID=3457424 RepID=UPI003FD288DD